jgi:hypothetical protein
VATCLYTLPYPSTIHNAANYWYPLPEYFYKQIAPAELDALLRNASEKFTQINLLFVLQGLNLLLKALR